MTKMRHVRSTVLGAVAALAIAMTSASASVQPRVIGGDVANPSDWSAAVALTVDPGPGSDQQICGGALIAPQRVLTAKHCVYGSLDPTLEVVVGRRDLTQTNVGEEIDVVARHRHRRADIAVLDLATPSSEEPFALATWRQDRARTDPGDPLWVAGWGATKPWGGGSSDILLEAKQYARPGRLCARAWPFYENRTMICALGRRLSENRHRSSCFGDSGGPLVADIPAGRILVGTVSGGGFRCGDLDEPPYYVRVAAFRRWIQDRIP